MKIVTVVGARPQFVKAAVVSRAIAEWNGAGRTNIDEVLVHTGQHYDERMSDVFFEQMDIPRPSHYLDVNRKSHGAMTGAMLEKIETLLETERPDVMLVYGDTNSTLAGALAASKLHIPVAHVEAGLRSRNMRMPEEVNRILTDRISTWLFCPTAAAVGNLETEGIGSWPQVRYAGRIGDVMLDASTFYLRKGSTDDATLRAVAALGLPERYLLATVHREENTTDASRLSGILEGLRKVAGEIPVVLPLHPGTAARIRSNGFDTDPIRMIDPLGYMEMLQVVHGSAGVLTDSGGLQKEAYFLGRPCVTLRDETEWVELVEAGANRLAGADRRRIVEAAREIAGTEGHTPREGLYGEGRTGQRILEELTR